MKLEIKTPKIIDNCVPLEVTKLDIRLAPARVVSFVLPYAEINRQGAQGLRCPGLDSPSVFTGTFNGSSLVGRFKGGRMVGVKGGRAGVSYEVELDSLEINWSGNAEPANRGSETSENIERGDDFAAPALLPAEPGAADVAAEAAAIEPAP